MGAVRAVSAGGPGSGRLGTGVRRAVVVRRSRELPRPPRLRRRHGGGCHVVRAVARRGDVRCVRATPGAHERPVEGPTARGAVVHPRSFCADCATRNSGDLFKFALTIEREQRNGTCGRPCVARVLLSRRLFADGRPVRGLGGRGGHGQH
ncbi:hypothetical protein CU044_0979 [Streptomyces sp. L-9-10]|nr:hypothetical protein CU044_0979 [Streptomyces sp. L-9-10]